MTDKSKKNHTLTDAEAEKLAQQAAELTDALQRERADATNLRRRHDAQIAGLKSSVKASVVKDLLPVIDNVERALKHVPEKPSQTSSADKQGDYTEKLEAYAHGVAALVKQFERTLTDIGVERIKTTGEPFDPKYHEAISMEESDGSTEIVSEELQAGYKIGDDVIRHAMVRVKMA